MTSIRRSGAKHDEKREREKKKAERKRFTPIIARHAGEEEREKEREGCVESAMWTQSRSTDQLIDYLDGGCYLGGIIVSGMTDALYWRHQP